MSHIPRVYLDWNAASPLRPSAKAAMISAMDIVGNPSSVHAEGRAAKALLERARADIAETLGAEDADIVFTSGATEAAALALSGRQLQCADIEHEAVSAWCAPNLPADTQGQVYAARPENTALQLANSETGILQTLPSGIAVCDLTQAFGKIPCSFHTLNCDMAFVSAHKLGGPKGIGALILKQGLDLPPQLRGGGQEMGRRAGTENLIGIAGFAAAARAAHQDISAGLWDEVAQFRNILNLILSSEEKTIISVGNKDAKLPNTLCLIAPEWRSETQVMAMDLQGYAISAGSACSSGKVKTSRVLRAMGYNEQQAKHTIRISLGPDITREAIERFANIWLATYRRVLRNRKE